MNPSASSPPPAKTIAIVDDQPENLNVLEAALARAGYRVVVFPRGELALAAAREEPPDLGLFDVRMPDLDGYELCRRFKADERLRDIPILFISALSATEDIAAGFECGGVDYIAKPFHEVEVLARVRTHLALRQAYLELAKAFERIKTLQGIIPICASCKKIRDDQGYWHQVEAYVRQHTLAEFSHGICPECLQRMYPDLALERATDQARCSRQGDG